MRNQPLEYVEHIRCRHFASQMQEVIDAQQAAPRQPLDRARAVGLYFLAAYADASTRANRE